jgi:hypothetical protein
MEALWQSTEESGVNVTSQITLCKNKTGPSVKAQVGDTFINVKNSKCSNSNHASLNPEVDDLCSLIMIPNPLS